MMEVSADLNAAVEEARFFVYNYNATTLVTTAGLALGLFFVITALALYYYYYSNSTDDSRSGGYWQYAGNDRTNLPGLVEVLGLLEKAWAVYGIEEDGCRRRVACESALLVTANDGVASSTDADALRHLLSQVTDDLLNETNDESKASVRDLLLASQFGRKAGSCQRYVHQCPHLALSDLTTPLPTAGTP